jgi:hypothetical protein
MGYILLLSGPLCPDRPPSGVPRLRSAASSECEQNRKEVVLMSLHLTAPVALAIVGLMGRWLFRRRKK